MNDSSIDRRPVLTAMLLLVLSGLVHSKTVEIACGSRTYAVSLVQAGKHPLERQYRLYDRQGQTSQSRPIFSTEEGDWFYAQCVAGAAGEPLLVFQTFCGGSACVEDRYGAIDPIRGLMVLRPGKSNASNRSAAQKVIGRPPPHLPAVKGACCDQLR